MLTDADHSRLAHRFVHHIIGDAVRAGAGCRQLLELAETCVLAACLAASTIDDDDFVLRLMVANVKQRLACQRLAEMVPAGHA